MKILRYGLVLVLALAASATSLRFGPSQTSSAISFSTFKISVTRSNGQLIFSSPKTQSGQLHVISSNGNSRMLNWGESQTIGLQSASDEPSFIEYSRPAEEADFQGFSDRAVLSQELQSGAPLQYTEVEGIGANDFSTNLEPNAANAATNVDRTFIRYLTFIPTEYVDAPDGVCTWADTTYTRGHTFVPHYFNGNNRSWDPDAIYNSKTAFTVGVNWALNGALTTNKQVGETRLYEENNGAKDLVASDTAGTEGMTLIPKTVNANYVSFEMKEDVTNPLCTSGWPFTHGITFDYTIDLFHTGDFSMIGVSLAVPNHELYYLDSGSATWTPVMRRTLNSFQCLWWLNAQNDNCNDSGNYRGHR